MSVRAEEKKGKEMKRALSALAVAMLLSGGPLAARTVTIRLGADFSSLDPAKTLTTDGYQMASVLYDRLLAIRADGTLGPGLATAWKATNDTATFTIKQDATCSDGTKVTPSVVAASLTRMNAKETNAPYAYRSVGSAGYTVTGDDAAWTVTVKTNAPFSDLLVGMAMPWTSIVCPAGLKDPDKLVAQPSGSGPYTLDASRSVRGDHYTLVPRPGYDWGPWGMKTSDPGMPTLIVTRVINNNTTAANELIAGNVDLGPVIGQDLARLKADPNLTATRAPVFGMFFMEMQHAAGHMTADATVRRAIATAINRDSVNRAATFGNGITASSYIGPDVPCFDPKTADMFPKPDPKAANALLLKDGWTAGAGGVLQKDGKPLTIRLIGNPESQNSAPEYVLQALKEMGADVQLRNMTLVEAATVFKTDDWDVGFVPFGPPMPSPNTVTGFVSGKGGINYSNIDNQDFLDARAKALAAMPDSPDRCKYWGEAQEALLKNFDILPLFADVITEFARKGITFKLMAPFVIDFTTVRAQ
jgi:peptide/nickel transport system substrate-binding protein